MLSALRDSAILNYEYDVLPEMALYVIEEPESRSFFLFFIPQKYHILLSEPKRVKKYPGNISASEVITLIRAVCIS